MYTLEIMKRYKYEILSGVTGTTFQVPIFLEASVDEMGIMVGFDGEIEQVEQFCNFTYVAVPDSSVLPTPTPTESPCPINPTSTPSVTPTKTIPATPSVTSTVSTTPTPSVTESPCPNSCDFGVLIEEYPCLSVTPTVTPSISPSMTPSMTPTHTPVVSPSITPTHTPSITPESTPSVTPTHTPSVTPTHTTSVTPTPSATSYVPTEIYFNSPLSVSSDMIFYPLLKEAVLNIIDYDNVNDNYGGDVEYTLSANITSSDVGDTVTMELQKIKSGDVDWVTIATVTVDTTTTTDTITGTYPYIGAAGDIANGVNRFRLKGTYSLTQNNGNDADGQVYVQLLTVGPPYARGVIINTDADQFQIYTNNDGNGNITYDGDVY